MAKSRTRHQTRPNALAYKGARQPRRNNSPKGLRAESLDIRCLELTMQGETAKTNEKDARRRRPISARANVFWQPSVEQLRSIQETRLARLTHVSCPTKVHSPESHIPFKNTQCIIDNLHPQEIQSLTLISRPSSPTSTYLLLYTEEDLKYSK